MVDLGFSEGGFFYSIARETSVTTPIFNHFGERLLTLPVNQSIFNQDLC